MIDPGREQSIFINIYTFDIDKIECMNLENLVEDVITVDFINDLKNSF